jgi:hypothetical protein
MSQGQTNTFDATTAGLTFTAPDITLTSTNMAINSGLSFDIPLASLTMSQNRALDFVNANTINIGRAMWNTTRNGTNGLEMTINPNGATVDGVASAALSHMFALNTYAITTAENIFSTGAATQRYAAKKNSRLCFITTAICEHEGKPDNCQELTLLRAWRDAVLRYLPGGQSLINVYYKVAPAALEKIKASENAPDIFRTMRTMFLNPSIEAIKAGDHAQALNLYCALLDYALAAAEDC